MKKSSNKGITVKCYYKKDGADVEKILADYVLELVWNEVQKSCA